MPPSLPLLLLSEFVVDSSIVMQTFFLLMAVGGLGFLYLTREKK
jgi:hypothetical protein